MSVIKRVQNTSSPNILFQVLRDGFPQNLGGSQVDFMMYQNGVIVNSGHTLCQLTDATFGHFTYDLQATDTATPGTITGEIQITYAGGEVEVQPSPIVISVRAR